MTPGPALPQTALGRGPSSPSPPVQQPLSLQALGAPRCSRAPLPSLTEPPPQGTAPGTEQGCKRRPQDGAGMRSPAASAPWGCPNPLILGGLSRPPRPEPGCLPAARPARPSQPGRGGDAALRARGGSAARIRSRCLPGACGAPQPHCSERLGARQHRRAPASPCPQPATRVGRGRMRAVTHWARRDATPPGAPGTGVLQPSRAAARGEDAAAGSACAASAAPELRAPSGTDLKRRQSLKLPPLSRTALGSPPASNTSGESSSSGLCFK